MAVSHGRWQNRTDLLLTPDDSNAIRRLAEENRYLFIDLQNSMLEYGCPAFSERFYINAYGDVQPCTFFPIGFGNLREEPLKAIWQKGLQWHLFSAFPAICPPAEDQGFIELWAKKQSTAPGLPISYREFHGSPSTRGR
jgi:MoaA/NifB/PqqE/SkfB family radical SAM enzyme